MTPRPRGHGLGWVGPIVLALLVAAPAAGAAPAPRAAVQVHVADSAGPNGSVVSNFSAALGRIVTLLGVAGGAILAIAWTRVAISWFSNDIAKKVQAKDRARDALIGSLIFAAALSGLFWALAQWVLSGQ